MTRWILPVAGAIFVALFAAAPVASAGTPPVYAVHKVGNYGGEPSIGTDATGALWSTFLSDHNVFRSTNNGTTWTPTTVPDPSTGDDCLGFDQSGAVYWCNLGGSQNTGPFQADVWKTVDHGKTWTYGNNPINVAGNNICGTSCQPFQVDRQWVDGYIPPGGTTDTAEVVLMYHDFGTGPSQIWTNISTDGGKTFGPSTNVLANFAPNAAQGAAVAEADSACNTIPSAVRIAKSGPHKGRIFLAWIAADPTSLVTGCNISQAQAYHNLIVAWSDDNGKTWTPQVAYDAGLFHDSSSPFASFTLDNQGNPYFGFINNLNWDPSCAVPNNPQTANCEVDMYVVWSADGGTTWQAGNGGGSGVGAGLIPGAAVSPFKVNSDTGTHWFPAIAAGDPGKVDVAWLETPSVVPSSANGKQFPGGCFPVPCTATTPWFLWAAQSQDLMVNGTPNQNPTWTTTKISVAPMHIADICNLGIACPPTANRNLADFISETLDTNGCAHINYADDNLGKAVFTADQVGGSCVLAATTTNPSPLPSASPTATPLPNTGAAAPWAGWPVIPVILATGAVAAGLRLRRRTPDRPS